jgi:UDP-GlcNAc:undecaprenyl-phosphate/decaprenyl-phosphate GlcNAc-1-phosphate transferase
MPGQAWKDGDMTADTSIYPLYLFTNVLVGLFLALVFGWGAIRLANRVGLVDQPGSLPHKRHTAATPLAGGLTLVASLVVGGVLFNFDALDTLWRFSLPALIVFAFGLWDDFKRLPAWAKLAGQTLAGILLIALGTYVQVLQPGFLGLSGPSLTWGNWLITMFWVLGITNAMNLIDSMDGIVIGTGSLALAFMILVTLVSTQEPLLQWMTLMLGINLGLYFYNSTPARFFLGDSGAQTTGFLLAAIAILFTPGERPLASSWFVPILILGLPIFDTTLVTFSRLLHKTSVYKAGRDHTYHRLLTLGLDSKRAVLLMHFATVVLGCLAFIALKLEPFYATLIFLGVCFAGLLILFALGKVKPNA